MHKCIIIHNISKPKRKILGTAIFAVPKLKLSCVIIVNESNVLNRQALGKSASLRLSYNNLNIALAAILSDSVGNKAEARLINIACLSARNYHGGESGIV